MKEPRTGVLIVNLGTPDAPTRPAVYRYLKQFLLDRRVIDYPWILRNLLVRGIIAPFRSGSSAKLYKELWTENGSPLKHYGFELAKGVQDYLGPDYVVELAMRYQNPSIEAGIKKLRAAGAQKLVIFPLFPQYASATTGSVHDEVMRIMRKQEVIPSVSFINSYFDEAAMIDVFVSNAKQYDFTEFDHILFSYHGVPLRQIKKATPGNHCQNNGACCRQIETQNYYCYTAQCHATSFAIAEKLGLASTDYTICFQSRLGPEKWLSPYTVEVIRERAQKGDKKILVFCPAFVADCLETLIEIGEEYQEEFEALGGEKIQLVESLNAHPDWIKGVAQLVSAEATSPIGMG